MRPKYPISSALLLTALSCLSAGLQAEPLKVFLLAGDEHVLEQALIEPAETSGTLLDVVARNPKYSFLQDDDGWEMEHFGGLGRVDGNEDSDADGVNNFFEYLYGSDPRDSVSRGFQLQAKPDNESNDIFFDWTVAERFALGSDYRVEVSTDLASWNPLPAGNYSIQQNGQQGKTHFELTLTHDYGNQVFIKLVQANN